MKLRQLKKQLQTQSCQTTKNKRRRYWFLFLFLILLIVVLLPLYQRQQLTAPQRIFAAAVKYESLGDIDGAQQSYQRLVQDFPHSELAAEALLRSGHIWQFDRQQDQQALLCFLQLEHDFPDHPLTVTAQESAAYIIKFSLRDYSRAIGCYQRLLEQPGDKQDRYLYEIADCYFRLDNYSQARIELETLLEQYPESSLVADVLYRKAGLLLLENRLKAAQSDWQQLVERFPESHYSRQARFNLAQALEEEDHLLEALERYKELEAFPYSELLREKIEHLQQRIAAKKKAL